MKNDLAPKIVRSIGNLFILWFQKSNKYVVVQDTIYNIIKTYLDAVDKTTFIHNLEDVGFDNALAEIYFDEVSLLLYENSKASFSNNSPLAKKKTARASIIHHYSIDSKYIRINYSSEHTKKLIHPQLEYLIAEVHSSKKLDSDFNITENDDHYLIFNNNELIATFKKNQPHLLKGKFTMVLLCLITQSEESDWIGTFHASSISKNDKGVMLIGKSGSGKSTLTTNLVLHGFDLIADDITPVHKDNLHIHSYSSAISLKQGGFLSLKRHINNSEHLKQYNFNDGKGPIRYVNINTFKTINVVCNKLILINYKNTSQTLIEEIALSEALAILIPDSWLSPLEENASRFLDWLEQLKCYRLTYSNNTEAIDVVNDILN